MRDATAKAMESDLKRIGLSNEQDLLDLERKFKSEERRLKEGIYFTTNNNGNIGHICPHAVRTLRPYGT